MDMSVNPHQFLYLVSQEVKELIGKIIECTKTGGISSAEERMVVNRLKFLNNLILSKEQCK